MKIPAVLLVCIGISLCCTRCSSVRVPGESKLRQKNIAIEYYTIAEAYADLKNYDKAVEYYTKALSEKSIKEAAYYKLGRCSALAQDYDTAEKIFKTLLKKDPDNIDITTSLAYVYAMQGDVKHAVRMYEAILQNNPDILEPRKNYITLLIHKEEFEQAKVQLDILKEKFPDDEAIPSFWEKIYGTDSEASDEDTEQSLP